VKIDLSNQSYLVTGAGSGIGAACGKFLGSAGAKVWVNDRNPDAAEAVVSRLRGDGAVAFAVPGDVGEPGPWLEPVAEGGALNGIVHCAGFHVPTVIGEAELAVFHCGLRAMVTGPFEITQRLLPNLTDARGACVVFVASVHAMTTEPGVSGYAAAKGAQVSMVRSMFQDLGPKRIRVLSVCPGYVDTPLLAEFFDSQPDPQAARDRADALHPMGRIGTPEDVAGLITFLVSPQAEFINGSSVVIDGGLTAMLYDG
jgi:NAD(P)-dependent dehydrogenase (short-subunit alcohol dehydrogenase family)